MNEKQAYRIRLSAPQPLGKRIPEERWTFLTPRMIGLTSDPLLALAMRVVSSWAFVELEWGKILSALLRAEYSIVMDMWLALSGARAQHDAIRAAATRRLPADDMLVFDGVRKAVRPVQKRRNMYVHHLWALTPSRPDLMTLVDPRLPLSDEANIKDRLDNDPDLWNLAPETVQALKGFEPVGDQGHQLGHLFHDDRLKALSFTESDINMDINAVLTAQQLVYHLRVLAGDSESAAQARSWLRSELRFA